MTSAPEIPTTTPRRRPGRRAVALGAAIAALGAFAGVVPGASSAPRLVPRLGRSAIVSRVSGRVTFLPRGARRFRALKGSVRLAMGSQVDTTDGVADLEVATKRATAVAVLSHGRFSVRQQRSDTTTLQLTAPLQCPRGAAIARRRRRRRRTLWSTESGGPFVTQGQYASAAGRGTSWITTDDCTSTEVHVRAGQVEVHNFATHQQLLLATGQTIVSAPASRPRPGGRYVGTTSQVAGPGSTLEPISFSVTSDGRHIDNFLTTLTGDVCGGTVDDSNLGSIDIAPDGSFSATGGFIANSPISMQGRFQDGGHAANGFFQIGAPGQGGNTSCQTGGIVPFTVTLAP
jgi:hypothetical protein